MRGLALFVAFAHDDRGFIIPLDDDDLERLVEERKVAGRLGFGLLKERFDTLVM